MSHPATVIAGHDGTSRGLDAIAHAQRIAADRDARVVAVHVIEPQMPFTGIDAHYQHQQRDRATNVLGPVREAYGSSVETRLVSATTAPAGLREAAEDEHAVVVVVGPSHHGPVGQVLYGDVARWLTTHCDCLVDVAPVGEHAAADERL